ncbi:MAG: DUF2116 family Zn-ribbon domain-containing protein [Thermoplasmatota archaeon]
MAPTKKKSPKERSHKKRKKVISDHEEPEEKFKPIPEHKHCNNCGLSIPPDREFCSTTCRTTFEKMVKRKKQIMWLPFIGAILLILFMLLIGGV